MKRNIIARRGDPREIVGGRWHQNRMLTTQMEDHIMCRCKVGFTALLFGVSALVASTDVWAQEVDSGPPGPSITVFKQVVCEGPSGCSTFGINPAVDSKSATGAKGTNCPSFCYKIRVENTGQENLMNVTVTDDHLSLAACNFPSSLAPGQLVECIIAGVLNCTLGTTTNTVVAQGDAFNANAAIIDEAVPVTHVASTNRASVTVLTASVACSLRLYSSFDMDGDTNDNHVLLPDSGPVQAVLTVTNTGSVDLLVTIGGLVCELQNAVQPLNGAFPVAAGHSEIFDACIVDVTCPNGTNLSVTVQGTAAASTAIPCVYSRSVSNTIEAITTAASTCTASVDCQSPVGSRVTGGGVLLPVTVDQSCIEVRTTISPSVVNGLTVIKVTHGGQLGAPFGHMGCGGILGDPCIRGQWQHTRHYAGKAHPRDVIDMSFTTAKPKGVFDSLQWACLGCCDPVSGAFITPVVVGNVCNPDDHEVCGPQPRPAPANAIIYSGIGKVTPTTDSGANTKAAEWVIVRVYIEDRSEPGGFHPEGAVEPADIYCLQAWKTGIKVSKKPDYSTISTAFRMALGKANCDFLTALRTGALPIGTLPSPIVNGVTADIQDCGPLATGNEQLHPSTSATCTPSLNDVSPFFE